MRLYLSRGRTQRRLHLAGALAVATIACAPSAFGGAQCNVPDELMRVDETLPHLSERLHEGGPVKIVAIGGASTIGAAAGSANLAYPHRLQEVLSPRYFVTVRKTPGGPAPDETARAAAVSAGTLETDRSWLAGRRDALRVARDLLARRSAAL